MYEPMPNVSTRERSEAIGEYMRQAAKLRSGRLDRRKAALIGLIGGAVGAYAMRYYTRKIVPVYFPFVLRPAISDGRIDPLEKRAFVKPRYDEGETTMQVAGRVVYTNLAGKAPRYGETRELLGDIAEWAYLILIGMVYGGTRTTTRPRDIAGGFFMGIRLWLADEVFAPLLGLRAGPTRFTIRQHAVLLSAYWVYSFIMANLTRILYRILP